MLSERQIDELTAQYLRAITQAWGVIHVGEKEIPLAQIFVELQALDIPTPGPWEKRTELNPMRSQAVHSGDSDNKKESRQANPQVEGKKVLGHAALDLHSVLDVAQYLVLLGEPGGGKSTTLQFIGLCFAEENGNIARLGLKEKRIPVFLNLPAVESALLADNVLIDVLVPPVRQFLQCPIEVATYLIRTWGNAGSLLLILDGLDEVADSKRAAVRNAISNFAHSDIGQQSRIIVASRLIGYSSLGKPFRDYGLKPFDRPDESRRYLRGWLAVLGELSEEEVGRQSSSLLKQLQEQPALRSVLDNPLHLRLSAEAFARTGSASLNRQDLYAGAIEEAWSRAIHRGASPNLRNPVMEALEVIAWHLHTGGDPDEAVLLATLVDAQNISEEEASRRLEVIHVKMGLLIWMGERLVFNYFTFQEYLVAKRLAVKCNENWKMTWAFLEPRLHLPEWREPLLLCSIILGGTSATLLQRIFSARSSYERLLHRDLLLASLCLLNGALASREIKVKMLTRLTYAYLEALAGKASPMSMDYGENVSTYFDRRFSSKIDLESVCESVLQTVGTEYQETIARLLLGQVKKRNYGLLLLKDILFQGVQRRTLLYREQRIRAVIQIFGRLGFYTSQIKEFLFNMLKYRPFAAQAADAMVNLDVGTPELAQILLRNLQHHRANGGWDSTVTDLVESLGRLGQKSNDVVATLIDTIRQPKDMHEDRKPIEEDVNYPIGWALCKAAETNVAALAFVLEKWQQMTEGVHDIDRDLFEGLKAGRNSMRVGTEEIILHLIERWRNARGQHLTTTHFLEKFVGKDIQIQVLNMDYKGGKSYQIENADEKTSEGIMKAILDALKVHPPVGDIGEDTLISILAHWVLLRPKFLPLLIQSVDDMDAAFLADRLRIEIRQTPPGDNKRVVFLKQCIERLVSPSPEIQEHELGLWQRVAEEDLEGKSSASWFLEVVGLQKCFFLYRCFANTYQVFWAKENWDEFREYDAYALASIACFRVLHWSSPHAFSRWPGWKRANSEFQIVSQKALSIVQDRGDASVDTLIELFRNEAAPKSVANEGLRTDVRESVIESLGLDQGKGKISFETQIAAAYGLALLSKDHPRCQEVLVRAAREFLQIEPDYAEHLFQTELREHIFRALGCVHKPGREVVELLLDAVYRDADSGEITLVEQGIGEIRSPTTEAVNILIQAYMHSTASIRPHILAALCTVESPSSDLLGLMMRVLQGNFPYDAKIGFRFLIDLPSLEPSRIRMIARWINWNGFAAGVVALQAHSLVDEEGNVREIRQIARVMSKRTSSYHDIYRYGLARLMEICERIEGSHKSKVLFLQAKRADALRLLFLGVGAILILGLIGMLGVVSSGAQDVLKGLVLPWLQRQSLIALILLLAGVAAIIGVLGWVAEHLRDWMKTK